MSKTIQDINQKINKKKVKVVTADEMTQIVRKIGAEGAAEEVDVVTTGTFGAMCSSGVWINFGHSQPPIKMSKAWLNDVEAYTGVAAVDAYIGVTQISESLGMEYGGAHVIEDLVSRRPVIVRAEAYGTDCYPRKRLETEITIEDLNQTVMSNPRNAYQKYAAATNSTSKIIYTYMGKLLPNFGNITYSGAGELSPLMNDPSFKTIGIGTKIFLGGAQEYITGCGTQHDPENEFSTLMVQGDLKKMSREFLRAAVFKGYGCTLYIGLGVPIPILNAEIAKSTGISDKEIVTFVLDYGIPSRSRPVLKRVSYEQLKSGIIEMNGLKVKTSPLSSYFMAKKIAETLKKWIKSGSFYLTEAVEKLPLKGSAKPMLQKEPPISQLPVKQKFELTEGHIYIKMIKDVSIAAFAFQSALKKCSGEISAGKYLWTALNATSVVFVRMFVLWEQYRLQKPVDGDMKRKIIRIKETIATIVSDEEFIPVGVQEILRQRRFLESYIHHDSLFYHTLEPYEVPDEAPEIIRRMAEAGSKMGVGPMSSVAGAIAEYAARAMVNAGARHVLVDNGGILPCTSIIQ